MGERNQPMQNFIVLRPRSLARLVAPAVLCGLLWALPPQAQRSRAPGVEAALVLTPACAQLREIAARNAPDYFFAQPAATAQTPHPPWRELVNTAQAAEFQTIAAVWVRGGKVRYVSITTSDAKGGTSRFDDDCFDAAGSLRYLRSELRVPNENAILVHEATFSANGRPRAAARRVLNLTTLKPRPPLPNLARAAEAPVYQRVSDLPFSRLLPHP